MDNVFIVDCQLRGQGITYCGVNNTQSVGLVLNPHMGHVSLQFHIKHNNLFETATGKPMDFDSPEPWWQYLLMLDTTKEIPTTMKKASSLVNHNHLSQRNYQPSAKPGLPARENNEPGVLIKDPEYQEVGNATVDQKLPFAAEGDNDLTPANHYVEGTSEPLTTTTPMVQQQTHSGRRVHNTEKYQSSLEQRQEGLVAWEILLDPEDCEDEPTQEQQYEFNVNLNNPWQSIQLPLMPMFCICMMHLRWQTDKNF